MRITNGWMMRIGAGAAFVAVAAVLILAATGLPMSASTAALKAAQPVARAHSAKPRPILAAATPVPATVEPVSLVVKRVLPIDEPIRFGTWYWDEAGVPKGTTIITVDLEAQVLSVFRDGYEIGTTAVMYGLDDKPTPLGTFPITQKDATHVSNLYQAPMPYMLRLTNDGVSIHGSPEVRGDGATHGCIGLPIPFAKKLFAAVKLGDRVIITRGKTLGVGGALAPVV